MGNYSEEPRSWRSEPISATLAFIAVFLLSLFLGVTILVGVFDIEPRQGAVLALLPACILAVLAAINSRTRHLFGSWYFFGG